MHVIPSSIGSKPLLESLFRPFAKDIDDMGTATNNRKRRQEEIRMSKLDRYFGDYGYNKT